MCVCDSADEMCACVLWSCSASPDRTLAPTANTAKDERRGREGQKGRKRETWHFICDSLLLIFAEEYLQHEATEHDRSTDFFFLLSSSVSAGE